MPCSSIGADLACLALHAIPPLTPRGRPHFGPEELHERSEHVRDRHHAIEPGLRVRFTSRSKAPRCPRTERVENLSTLRVSGRAPGLGFS